MLQCTRWESVPRYQNHRNFDGEGNRSTVYERAWLDQNCKRDSNLAKEDFYD
jgi:hypothetical protein